MIDNSLKGESSGHWRKHKLFHKKNKQHNKKLMLPEEQAQQQEQQDQRMEEEEQQDYPMDQSDNDSDYSGQDEGNSSSNDDHPQRRQSSSPPQQPGTAFIQFVMIPVVRNENGEQVEDRGQAFTGHFIIPWSMLSNSRNNGDGGEQQQEQQQQRQRQQQQQRIMNLLYYMFQMQQQQEDEKKLGTDRKQIDALPVYSIQHTCPYQQQFGDCNRECTICLCDSSEEDGEQWMILPCGHSFHKDCLLPWLDNHHTCPSCRFELQMANVDLERERVARMARDYGEDGLKLMNLSSSIHNMYSQYQKLVSPSSDENPADLSVFKLNQIDASLTASMYQLDSVTIIPSSESEQQQQQQQQQYQKWDQNRTRSVRRQLIHRIQYLQSLMDKIRASGGLSSSSASPLYPQASAL